MSKRRKPKNRMFIRQPSGRPGRAKRNKMVSRRRGSNRHPL